MYIAHQLGYTVGKPYSLGGRAAAESAVFSEDVRAGRRVEEEEEEEGRGGEVAMVAIAFVEVGVEVLVCGLVAVACETEGIVGSSTVGEKVHTLCYLVKKWGLFCTNKRTH